MAARLRTGGIIVALLAGVMIAPKLPALLPDSVGKPLSRWLGSAEATDVIGTLITSTRALNELTVLEAQMFAIARTADRGWLPPLDTTTYVIVPGAVRYAVDLAGIDRRNLNWDPATATLVAVLPEPRAGTVNIDGARARVIVDGLDLASGDKREAVLKASLAAARDDMARQATQGHFREAARTAARAALQQNLAAPLVAAGLKPVVIVRFRGEAALPPART